MPPRGSKPPSGNPDERERRIAFDWDVFSSRSASESRFLRKVLIFYGVTAGFLLLALLLVFASDVVLLVFSGALLAILLDDACDVLQNRLPVSREQALAIVVATSLILLGVVGWLLAPTIVEQANQLASEIPRALGLLKARYAMVSDLVDALPSINDIAANTSAFLARAGVFFSGMLGAVAAAVVATVIALYLAVHPRLYVDGILMVVPPTKRERANEVLGKIARALSQWLRGKLLTMLIIGLLTSAGLAVLGVPMPLVLGILAGLLDFIPYLGPIMAGIPAVLIAFTDSPLLALYTVLLFVGLNAAEGYLLMPLIEQRTVSLPPALTIFMQVLLGTFYGLAGVALATPLTAVLAVLVTTLYVRDVLGEDVKVPGEH